TKPGPDLGVVVAFVEAAVLRTPWPAVACTHDDAIDGVERELHVGAVRAGDHDGDGHARPVRHYAAFRARFRAVGRVRTREVPPWGALTMAGSSAVQSRSRPFTSS